MRKKSSASDWLQMKPTTTAVMGADPLAEGGLNFTRALCGVGIRAVLTDHSGIERWRRWRMAGVMWRSVPSSGLCSRLWSKEGAGRWPVITHTANQTTPFPTVTAHPNPLALP
jgi:hypothetical protein